MEIEKTLHVRKREQKGKGPSGRLRAQDEVPGIFYTASGENIMVQASALPLDKIYEIVGHTAVFNLEIESDTGKETHPVIIWQAQRHPYKKKFLHIDYYGVDLNKEIKVDVPLEFVGTAKGAKLGGILEAYREVIPLVSKPMAMPQKIVVDISDMDIGDSINVEDLKLPEDVKAVYDHNFAIASIITPSQEDEIEEGATETTVETQ